MISEHDTTIMEEMHDAFKSEILRVCGMKNLHVPYRLHRVIETMRRMFDIKEVDPTVQDIVWRFCDSQRFDAGSNSHGDVYDRLLKDFTEQHTGVKKMYLATVARAVAESQEKYKTRDIEDYKMLSSRIDIFGAVYRVAEQIADEMMEMIGPTVWELISQPGERYR